MVRLKNFENAYIDLEKLIGYSLNEFHPIGKYKSIVFKKVLGIDQSDASLLKDLIIKGLSNAECETREKDQYGERFTVDIKISIFD